MASLVPFLSVQALARVGQWSVTCHRERPSSDAPAMRDTWRFLNAASTFAGTSFTLRAFLSSVSSSSVIALWRALCTIWAPTLMYPFHVILRSFHSQSLIRDIWSAMVLCAVRM